ncbi:LuxR family transcriptional regulator [Actinomycetospora sp. NBRC 106375]|uniref:ATP-binding protein n=1 Tax=Actinomycetospora sp. NBRC 106375 TaxID=3032207 RepID=UPI0024A46707|nr:AAA family ATPase [Actinomycetospora sp. NBRC 106375]GLZ45665.1 LuxR family transcriptional regulator [Actinomycetospora sp. NBRC 106375]
MELLERDDELRLLDRAWREARAGSGSIVLLAGESGIGKTSLARQFAGGVDDGDVLWGVCDPLGVPRPLGPLHDVAADLGDPVASLLHAGAPPHEIHRALLDALSARPRVLVVDDLQWADEATIDLLRFLLRRIAGTRSLVLATYRADEPDPQPELRALLGDVARTPAATRRELGPLSVAAVTALVGERDIDPARLHHLTRGNSFFVTEVVSQGGDLPLSVRDAVLARTAGLDAEARDLADLLACAPGPVPDTLLPALGVGIAPLRTLDSAGLLARDRRGITYRHDICRLAVADAIPPGGEVALHRRMVEALETLPDADPAVLAHHALAAGDDGRAFRYASRAGRVAAGSGAHTEAARFFATALERAPRDALGARAGLCELLANELYLTDRLDEAVAACERAISWWEADEDPDGVGTGRQSLAVFEWYRGNRRAAEENAAAAVAVLRPRATSGSRAAGLLGSALTVQGFLALHGSDLAAARRLHDEARAAAAGVVHRDLDVQLTVVDAVAAVLAGDLAERDRLLAVLDAAGDGFTESHSTGWSNMVNVDVEQRRLDAAEKALDRALPLSVQWDVPLCYGWQRGVRGRLRMLRGSWDEAVRDAGAVLGESASLLTHTWPRLVQGVVALRRGEPGSDADLERAWDLAVRYAEPLRLLPAVSALAERSWVTGEPDLRLDRAPELLADAGARPGAEWSAGELAVWLTRLGYAVDAPALPVDCPFRLSLDGDHAAAAERWAELGAPYDRALALVDSGEPGDVFAGLEILDRLGAEAVAAKVRRDLRGRGVSGVPSRPRAATRANPAGLTARQVDVLRLLAEGLTNAGIASRLFISEKTADHHVSAILAKLDVGTRREAASAARSLGLAPDRRRVPTGT